MIKSTLVCRLRAEQLEDRRMLAITVDTLTDVVDANDDATSLREAIAATNAGVESEINFSVDGTINLNGAELEITNTLSIDGGDQITIDAQGTSRVLNFSATSGNLTLTGITVTGGDTSGNGGGIRFKSGGELTLTSSTVSGNSATGNFDGGGGIYTDNGAVTLISSTVSGNTGTFRGGGIYSSSGSVTLTNSTVTGNTTTGLIANGGGIHASFGSVTLTSSTVSGNTATSLIADGGGVHATFGAVTVLNSTISGNTSGGEGGGISSSGSVTLKNSTVTGNTAGNVAGGVNSTVVNRPFVVQNSIIAGNTASTAPDLRHRSVLLTIDHSLVGNTHDSGITPATGTGNVLNQPALLGLLADNGGPTLTHALLPGSPAIDAGDQAAIAGLGDVPLFDQRGEGFDRILGGRIDIGALEVEPAVRVLGDSNGDGVVNLLDLDTLGKNFSLSPATFEQGDFNEDGVVNLLDLDILGTNFGTSAPADSVSAAATTLAGGEPGVASDVALALLSSEAPVVMPGTRAVPTAKSIVIVDEDLLLPLAFAAAEDAPEQEPRTDLVDKTDDDTDPRYALDVALRTFE